MREFNSLCPGRITPKFHNLVQHPSQIRKHGPLRHLWCMWFEAKHQYFKAVASQLHNFKNVAYSLVKRHQMRLCWKLTASNSVESQPCAQNCSSIPFHELTKSVRWSLLHHCHLQDSDISEDETVLSCCMMKMNGVQYSKQDLFILELLHVEEIPVFFEVLKILCFHSKWLLCGDIYHSIAFDKLLHAFVVEKNSLLLLLLVMKKTTIHWVSKPLGIENVSHCIKALQGMRSFFNFV